MIEDDPMAVDQFTAAVLKVAGPDGLAKTRAIAGGTEICLSTYPREGTVVVRALGMDDARKVYNELRVLDGDGRPLPFPLFYFPRLDASYANRQMRVLALAKEGKRGDEIAIELGISNRTVRKHIEKLRAGGELLKALPRPADAAADRKPCDLIAPTSPDQVANIGEMILPPDEVAP